MRQYLIFLFLLVSVYAQGQFSGSKLSEYQWGKLATADEEMFHAAYSKLMLNYTTSAFKFTVGGQAYYTPYADRNYFDPSWVSLSFKKKGWEVDLGNFNETIGRGILLRSYEIPGALLEDRGFRSKNYFYRDMLGASAGYSNRVFSLKGMWGYARNNIIPPTQAFDQQRTDRLIAFSASLNLFKQKLELSFLNMNNAVSMQNYLLQGISGQIIPSLTYYVAASTRLSGENEPNKIPYAFYSSLNFSLGNWGLSFELKDYHDFLIGAGVNEPPALVKEHQYRTLNRNTHILEPLNERGMQLETFYQPSLWTTLTLNYTLASNDFGQRYNYHELFAELASSLGDDTDLKVFADWAQDPLNNTENRISAGFHIEQSLGRKNGIKLETEVQRFTRFEDNVLNGLVSLTFRYTSMLYLSVLSELSNDSFLTEDDAKLWLGSSLRYKLNTKHNFTLFVGERRGGPACNAGICYEVLDFKGVELRWNARF